MTKFGVKIPLFCKLIIKLRVVGIVTVGIMILWSLLMRNLPVNKGNVADGDLIHRCHIYSKWSNNARQHPSIALLWNPPR